MKPNLTLLFQILNSELTDAFHLPYRRDRDNHGGGKIVFIGGLIRKRLENLETELSETVCLELTVSKKNGLYCLHIGLLKKITNVLFFSELNETPSKALNSYGNIIVIENLNMDDPDKDRNNNLSDFVDTFSVSNLINKKTCHKNLSGTTIDIMLTNRPNCLQKTSTVVTGLIGFNKIIISCLKTNLKKNRQKKIIFRGYKKFDEQNFLYDIGKQMIKGKFYKEKNMYQSFSDTFKAIVNKHALLKEKIIRRINVLFMKKELTKAIMNTFRLKKKYQDWSSRENCKNCKKLKNKCNKLCGKAKK